MASEHDESPPHGSVVVIDIAPVLLLPKPVAPELLQRIVHIVVGERERIR